MDLNPKSDDIGTSSSLSDLAAKAALLVAVDSLAADVDGTASSTSVADGVKS